MATKQKIYFIAQEYENKGYANYHEAQIEIIVKNSEESKLPYFGSSGLCRMSYQANAGESPKRYYGESMHISECNVDNLSCISAIYAKMKKYTDKIYDQGLTLNVYPIGDEYQSRIALLKAIGATRIYYDSSAREYSECPVCA